MDRYREQSNRLRILAHPIRLRIVEALVCDPECVCHLSALLHKPQPYVSQQLAVLRTAGLIQDEKEGTNVFYRLVDQRAAALVATALGSAGPAGRARIAGCPCPKCRGKEGSQSDPCAPIPDPCLLTPVT